MADGLTMAGEQVPQGVRGAIEERMASTRVKEGVSKQCLSSVSSTTTPKGIALACCIAAHGVVALYMTYQRVRVKSRVYSPACSALLSHCVSSGTQKRAISTTARERGLGMDWAHYAGSPEPQTRWIRRLMCGSDAGVCEQQQCVSAAAH